MQRNLDEGDLQDSQAWQAMSSVIQGLKFCPSICNLLTRLIDDLPGLKFALVFSQPHVSWIIMNEYTA